MTSTAINLFTKRRTQYALGKQLPISEAQVEALILEAVRQAPSSFNSQSSRVVVLFGAQHEKLWNITREVLRRGGTKEVINQLPKEARPQKGELDLVKKYQKQIDAIK